MIYTGGSLALLRLEKLAHTSGTSLYSGSFSVTMYNLPDKIKIVEIKLTDIIKNNSGWIKGINYPYTQAIGDHLLAARQTAFLKVPLAIIDLEYNYLLNPAHPDFDQIKIAVVEPFIFDTG